MDPVVADVFATALRTVYGNASSVHSPGQTARHQLEQSRRIIAAQLGCSAPEVVFTSGGTESNNLAIFGCIRQSGREFKHVVMTSVEHPSVLQTRQLLEREGVPVTCLPVDCEGRISASDLKAAIRPETVLVSVMHANNETGILQPLSEVARIVADRRATGQEVFLHADGVQAFGKAPLDLSTVPLDFYSVSAHKVYGPKGIGALYVRKGTPLRGIQAGGNHERQRRAGTENVPAAMAFAKAVVLFQAAEIEQLRALRDRFEVRLREAIPAIRINSAGSERLPNTSNITFPGITGEAMVISLDMRGMAVSTGAACSSGSLEPSHVLLAMGRTQKEARSRFVLVRPLPNARRCRGSHRSGHATSSPLRSSSRMKERLVV